MEQWMVALIDSDVALKVNSLLGFVWLGLFFVYYFSREGRDERGRKVIAIAALCAFIMLFIVMNVLGYVFGSGWGGQNVTRTMNCLQTAYSAVLLTAVLTVPVLEPLFQVAPLTMGQLGTVAGLSLGSMVLIQLRKLIRKG